MFSNIGIDLLFAQTLAYLSTAFEPSPQALTLLLILGAIFIFYLWLVATKDIDRVLLCAVLDFHQVKFETKRTSIESCTEKPLVSDLMERLESLVVKPMSRRREELGVELARMRVISSIKTPMLPRLLSSTGWAIRRIAKALLFAVYMWHSWTWPSDFLFVTVRDEVDFEATLTSMFFEHFSNYTRQALGLFVVVKIRHDLTLGDDPGPRPLPRPDLHLRDHRGRPLLYVELKREARLTVQAAEKLTRVLSDPGAAIHVSHNATGPSHIVGHAGQKVPKTIVRVVLEAAAYNERSKLPWSVLWAGAVGFLVYLRTDEDVATLWVSRPFGWGPGMMKGSIVTHFIGAAMLNMEAVDYDASG